MTQIRLTDAFGYTWILTDPTLEIGLFGAPYLRASYHEEGELHDYECGDFRLDTATEWEVLPPLDFEAWGPPEMVEAA